MILAAFIFIGVCMVIFYLRIPKRQTHNNIDDFNEQQEIEGRISKRRMSIQEYRPVSNFDAYKILSVALVLGALSFAGYYVYNNYFVECTDERALKVSFEKLLEVCTKEIKANWDAYNKLEDQQTILANKNDLMRKVRDERASKLNTIIQEDEVAFPQAEE
mgnify:CR=1 FL=1